MRRKLRKRYRICLLPLTVSILLSCSSVFAAGDAENSGTQAAATIQERADRFLQDKDYAQAVPLLERLAEKGYPEYQTALAEIYINGTGAAKDFEKARKLLLTASYRGDQSARLLLGKLYLRGEGVTQDFEEARKWFLSIGSAKPEAYVLLGEMYERGEGGEADAAKAIENFKEADSHGLDQKTRIARIYYFGGPGVEQNYLEAQHWFDDAASAGDPIAKFYPGKMYALAEGIHEDKKKAAELFVEAKAGLTPLSSGNELARRCLEKIDSEFKQYVDASAKDASTSSDKSASARLAAPEEVDKVFGGLTALLSKYYPRAKVVRKQEVMHFEFKPHKYATHNLGDMVAPQLGGIMGDVSVKKGRYPGKETLPYVMNESLYSSMLLAPYSTKSKCHLETRLLYPPNVEPEFLEKFKAVIDEFDTQGSN